MRDHRTWTGRVFIGVSLDGFIARNDGDIDWLTDPPTGRDHARIISSAAAQSWDTFFDSVDHVVMGRGTYEKLLTFGEWPYRSRTVIVLSSELTTEDPRIAVVRGAEEAAELLSTGGARQVYVDGGRVVQDFLRRGLIDELTVCWAPVLIGGGLSLFGDADRDIPLTLLASHTTDVGMVHTTYRVEHGLIED
ncbi:dihydrofolate reductase family protein [Nesterenkonia marinintestina]|uniref:dihydrofolate reductase family protein n=1 Tax=Nesterenkonia marinintestina TaxID=2979865 RepID=UPI0021C1B766|nr:dihydrofolate reductase family protein [Nesterenkonia sp. GX14115]